jgi:hypothetical protein
MDLILKDLRTMDVFDVSVDERMIASDLIALIKDGTLVPDHPFLTGKDPSTPFNLLHMKSGEIIDENRRLFDQGVESGDTLGLSRDLQLVLDLGMHFGGALSMSILSYLTPADILNRLEEMGRMPSVRMRSIRIFQSEGNRKLPMDQSLDDLDIMDGAHLRVEMEHSGTESFLHLLSDMGTVYLIRGMVATIGRSDLRGKFKPDIDLRHEDNGDTVSRDHGQVIFQNQGWYFEENPDGTTNGTWVGSQERKLQAGESLKLERGDRIKVGQVWLTFNY